MYSELIYTRCRQGIDILKEGRPMIGDGYKVHSCTSSLMKDGSTDLQFLHNAAQAKLPYSEPQFMDDAYLYFVPEKGGCFMQNFYPVPFDPNAKGDYTHRAGNFLNHIIVGDFTNFYPFELFRDSAVWNAKARGEGYYYANAPADLPVRDDIDNPVGQIDMEEIGAFIADGRQVALMSAVSFLIAQYALAAEERKFLLIRDNSEEKIEMWIAAIEYAFSPRMASSIPFATRMDKFATANKYTINQMGVYQTQINLQDKNQKLRYRAMIVGVDEHDKMNISSVRPSTNSPFVLLDGKEKKAMFEADITNPFFKVVTSFNDSHRSFCREFLQTIDITVPNSNVFWLYDIYEATENIEKTSAVKLGNVLTQLGRYKVFPSKAIFDIYSRVLKELPRLIKEEKEVSMFVRFEGGWNATTPIISWLNSVSDIVGDHSLEQK